MIKLLVGLGNPGEKYARTRHNAGFWLLERWAAQEGIELDRLASPLGWRSGAAKASAPSGVLLLPQTFMNASGDAVAEIAREMGLRPENILVAHDEMDLPIGAAKLKRGGGSGGHNGLKSVTDRLGSDDYWRLRLGIGHPRKLFNSPAAAEAGIQLESPKVLDFVLGEPGPEELRRLSEGLSRALDALPLALAGEPVKAMARLNASRA